MGQTFRGVSVRWLARILRCVVTAPSQPSQATWAPHTTRWGCCQGSCQAGGLPLRRRRPQLNHHPAGWQDTGRHAGRTHKQNGQLKPWHSTLLTHSKTLRLVTVQDLGCQHARLYNCRDSCLHASRRQPRGVRVCTHNAGPPRPPAPPLPAAGPLNEGTCRERGTAWRL
jgi:hypothetical protein